MILMVIAIIFGIANGKQSGTERVVSFIVNGMIAGYIAATMFQVN